MGTLTCSIHPALLPQHKRGQSECKSGRNAPASAKIERFEAQAVRKVCNGERRARGECVELSTSMEIWQKPWLMDERTFVHSPRVASDVDRSGSCPSYGFIHPLILPLSFLLKPWNAGKCVPKGSRSMSDDKNFLLPLRDGESATIVIARNSKQNSFEVTLKFLAKEFPRREKNREISFWKSIYLVFYLSLRTHWGIHRVPYVDNAILQNFNWWSKCFLALYSKLPRFLY